MAKVIFDPTKRDFQFKNKRRKRFRKDTATIHFTFNFTTMTLHEYLYRQARVVDIKHKTGSEYEVTLRFDDLYNYPYREKVTHYESQLSFGIGDMVWVRFIYEESMVFIQNHADRLRYDINNCFVDADLQEVQHLNKV